MIDQYKQAFQEEARELLVELESALLELDQNRDDPEVVGRAFRALHTIKGSGAMFGFDDIAGFTHHLETAFDQLRNGQLAVTADLINLALAAERSDQSHAGGGRRGSRRGSGPLGGNPGGGAAVDRAGGLRDPGQARHAGEDGQPAGRRKPDRARDWRIRFRPGPDVLVNGTNPLLLFGELRELGELEIEVDTSEVPPLDEIDPERCYLAWDMVLRTAAPPEAIRDVFIFVEDVERASHRDRFRTSAEASARAPAAKKDAPARPAAAGPGGASIRVSADKLDQLVNLVGELVTVQARLSEASARAQDGRDPGDRRGGGAADRRAARELDEHPHAAARTTFERFRRLVHDLGIELDKDVELAIEGADTELDKTVIDQLNDPLVHLIRNSMDHGIETPRGPPRGRQSRPGHEFSFRPSIPAPMC